MTPSGTKNEIERIQSLASSLARSAFGVGRSPCFRASSQTTENRLK